MISVLIVNEVLLGETPPVLYIRGFVNDYSRLLVAMLPFLKEKDYVLDSTKLNFFDKNGLMLRINRMMKSNVVFDSVKQSLEFHLDFDGIIDIFVSLAGMAVEPCHDYWEYQWNDLNIPIIVESI